jgi:hypothetical protein
MLEPHAIVLEPKAVGSSIVIVEPYAGEIRKTILGQKDAAWLYLTSHKFEFNSIVPTTEESISKYKKLYEQLKKAAPKALGRILAPEKLFPEKKEEAKGMPSLITTETIRFVHCISAHTDQECMQCKIPAKDFKETVGCVPIFGDVQIDQAPYYPVKNETGEICRAGDSLLMLVTKKDHKILFKRMPFKTGAIGPCFNEYEAVWNLGIVQSTGCDPNGTMDVFIEPTLISKNFFSIV